MKIRFHPIWTSYIVAQVSYKIYFLDLHVHSSKIEGDLNHIHAVESNIHVYINVQFIHMFYSLRFPVLFSPLPLKFSFNSLTGDILSQKLWKKQNQVQTTTFIFKILNHRHNQHSSNTCILHRYSYTTIKFVFTATNFQPKLWKNTSTLSNKAWTNQNATSNCPWTK